MMYAREWQFLVYRNIDRIHQTTKDGDDSMRCSTKEKNGARVVWRYEPISELGKECTRTINTT